MVAQEADNPVKVNVVGSILILAALFAVSLNGELAGAVY
jgi:hypothetical protein